MTHRRRANRRSVAGETLGTQPGDSGDGSYLIEMTRDLRTPMNAIIGMAGLLLEAELGLKQRQYAKGIHHAGETLSMMLNDVLDLARLAAGRLTLEPIPFDLRSMVEDTVSGLSPRAGERGIALRVDWRPDIPRQVVGDPGRLRQILGNLVGHAVNARSQGEVVLRISREGEEAGIALLRFTVEDTGIGIPPERLGRVFEEYVPMDASPYRSFGVTGLGLRISRELTRLMGGEIGAESVEGQGSRLWFIVPAPTVEQASHPVVEESPARQTGRALFVEADQPSRERYATQVTAAGWEVEFVDELAGVEPRLKSASSAGTPFTGCVLSDYAVRPAHEELARRLKADPEWEPVALVMLTAVGSPGEGKRLWHAGFAAYLRKPLSQEELCDTFMALEQVGSDGRCGALITRHSLAEARSSRGASIEGLDAVLDGLLAPGARDGPSSSPSALAELEPSSTEPESSSVEEAAVAVEEEPEAEAWPEADGSEEAVVEAVEIIAMDTAAVEPPETVSDLVRGIEESETTDRGSPLESLVSTAVDGIATDATVEDVEVVTVGEPLERVAWGPGDPEYSIGEMMVVLPPEEEQRVEEHPVPIVGSCLEMTAEPSPSSEAIAGAAIVDHRLDEPPIAPGLLEQLRPSSEGGGPTLALRLIDSFRTEAPLRAADLRAALDRGDADAVRRLARTLKAMSGLLGAAPLLAAAEEIENGDDLPAAAVDRLERELDRLFKATDPSAS